MKSRDNNIQSKRFQVREKTRQLVQLDMMINEFERMADELAQQITAEERKSGISDIHHFAYPTFARAARQRRDNLMESRAGLLEQREAAQMALIEAEAELERVELLENRDGRSRPAETTPSRAMIG